MGKWNTKIKFGFIIRCKLVTVRELKADISSEGLTLRGAGIVQWWERSPPTSVARVRFEIQVSCVGWVCCWFSPLLWGFFSGFPQLPPQKPGFPSLIWNQWTKSHSVEMPLQNSNLFYFIFIMSAFNFLMMANLPYQSSDKYKFLSKRL